MERASKSVMGEMTIAPQATYDPNDQGGMYECNYCQVKGVKECTTCQGSEVAVPAVHQLPQVPAAP